LKEKRTTEAKTKKKTKKTSKNTTKQAKTRGIKAETGLKTGICARFYRFSRLIWPDSPCFHSPALPFLALEAPF
jgi:hypothetical protein